MNPTEQPVLITGRHPGLRSHGCRKEIARDRARPRMAALAFLARHDNRAARLVLEVWV